MAGNQNITGKVDAGTAHVGFAAVFRVACKNETVGTVGQFDRHGIAVAVVRVNGVRGQDGEGSGSEGKFRSHGRMLRCEAFLFHSADKRFVGLTVVDIITADDIFYIKGIETSDQSGNMVGIIMAADQIVDG